MTTRSQSDALIPLSDPEAILRAANAAKRKAKIAAALAPRLDFPPLPSSPPPTMSTEQTAPTPQMPAAPSTQPPPGTRPPSRPDSLSMQDYLEGVIKLQHRSIDQANADRAAVMELRQADADRISRLEEALLRLTIKTDQPDTNRVEPNRIDLQRFRTTDGPLFNGPFQQVEPFVNWMGKNV